MKLNTEKLKVMFNRIRAPYVKNTITYNCKLYPSKGAARPLTSSNVSGSFDISLLVFVISVLAAMGIVYLSLRRKFKE